MKYSISSKDIRKHNYKHGTSFEAKCSNIFNRPVQTRVDDCDVEIAIEAEIINFLNNKASTDDFDPLTNVIAEVLKLIAEDPNQDRDKQNARITFTVPSNSIDATLVSVFMQTLHSNFTSRFRNALSGNEAYAHRLLEDYFSRGFSLSIDLKHFMGPKEAARSVSSDELKLPEVSGYVDKNRLTYTKEAMKKTLKESYHPAMRVFHPDKKTGNDGGAKKLDGFKDDPGEVLRKIIELKTPINAKIDAGSYLSDEGFITDINKLDKYIGDQKKVAESKKRLIAMLASSETDLPPSNNNSKKSGGKVKEENEKVESYADSRRVGIFSLNRNVSSVPDGPVKQLKEYIAFLSVIMSLRNESNSRFVTTAGHQLGFLASSGAHLLTEGELAGELNEKKAQLINVIVKDAFNLALQSEAQGDSETKSSGGSGREQGESKYLGQLYQSLNKPKSLCEVNAVWLSALKEFARLVISSPDLEVGRDLPTFSKKLTSVNTFSDVKALLGGLYKGLKQLNEYMAFLSVIRSPRNESKSRFVTTAGQQLGFLASSGAHLLTEGELAGELNEKKAGLINAIVKDAFKVEESDGLGSSNETKSEATGLDNLYQRLNKPKSLCKVNPDWLSALKEFAQELRKSSCMPDQSEKETVTDFKSFKALLRKLYNRAWLIRELAKSGIDGSTSHLSAGRNKNLIKAIIEETFVVASPTRSAAVVPESVGSDDEGESKCQAVALDALYLKLKAPASIYNVNEDWLSALKEFAQLVMSSPDLKVDGNSTTFSSELTSVHTSSALKALLRKLYIKLKLTPIFNALNDQDKEFVGGLSSLLNNNSVNASDIDTEWSGEIVRILSQHGTIDYKNLSINTVPNENGGTGCMTQITTFTYNGVENIECFDKFPATEHLFCPEVTYTSSDCVPTELDIGAVRIGRTDLVEFCKWYRSRNPGVITSNPSWQKEESVVCAFCTIC